MTFSTSYSIEPLLIFTVEIFFLHHMNEKLTSIFGGWWAISEVIEVQALLFSSSLQLVSCSVRSCQRVGKRNKNGNWSIWLFDSRPDERPGWKMSKLWAKLQFCLLPRICQEPTDAHGDSRPSSLSWRKKKNLPPEQWPVFQNNANWLSKKEEALCWPLISRNKPGEQGASRCCS